MGQVRWVWLALSSFVFGLGTSRACALYLVCEKDSWRWELDQVQRPFNNCSGIRSLVEGMIFGSAIEITWPFPVDPSERWS